MDIHEYCEVTSVVYASCDSLHDLLNEAVKTYSLSLMEDAKRRLWLPLQESIGRLGRPKVLDVVVIDFPSIFHASFEKDGDTAPAGTLSRIQTVCQQLGVRPLDPVYIAVDSETSWRREIHKGYKGSRPDKPDGFAEALKEAIQLCRDEGMLVCGAEHNESDDVMASISLRSKLLRIPCVIVTEDIDIAQCIGQKTQLYSRRKKQMRGESWLQAEKSIKPTQVVDYLCLTGKDDTPNCNGFGPETAWKLLAKYGDVMTIMDCRDQLTESRRKKIEEFVFSGSYFVAKELHTLRRNLPIQMEI